MKQRKLLNEIEKKLIDETENKQKLSEATAKMNSAFQHSKKVRFLVIYL